MDHLTTRPLGADFDNNLEFGGLPGGDKTRCDDKDFVERLAIRRNHGKHDERFLKQEKSIRRELNHALAERRIGLRTSELCQDAKIARSTFYTHYQSCDEALVWYELELEEEFVKSLSPNIRRDLAFTLLLSFVSKHQHYFASAFQGRNMYLLGRLVKHACVPVAELNRQAYILYVWSVGAMIVCWGECDKFAERKKEKYREQLMRLRVMDYGL